MKKMVLFIAALLLIGTTAQAADHQHSDHHDRVTKRYHHTQPIIFIQSGVKFFVYPEGEIDFKMLRTRSRNNVWSSHHSFSTPGGYYGYDNVSPYRRVVQYDYFGRLKRVGSNYITYDRFNRVRRIGSTYVRYNRRGLAYQIGGLNIYYNRYGNIKYVEGNVHYTGCGYCGIDGCTVTHDPYFKQDWRPNRHFDRNDNNHYYKNRKRKKKYHDHDDND